MNAQETDQSLEELAEREERREARHGHDPEGRLHRLIRELVREPLGRIADEEPPRDDEFVCRCCHMVLHRSRLVGGSWGLCSDCWGRAEHQEHSW